MHLLYTVDAVVLLIDPPELGEEQLIANSPGRGWPGLGRAVGPRGDEPTFRRTPGCGKWPQPAKHSRLSSMNRIISSWGTSSSAYELSRCGFAQDLIRAAGLGELTLLGACSPPAGALRPAAGPPHGRGGVQHIRVVSSPTPICGTITRSECERGPPWVAWRLRTIRTARSRSSGLYFWGMFRFSSSVGSERNPGRFRLLWSVSSLRDVLMRLSGV